MITIISCMHWDEVEHRWDIIRNPDLLRCTHRITTRITPRPRIDKLFLEWRSTIQSFLFESSYGSIMTIICHGQRRDIRYISTIDGDIRGHTVYSRINYVVYANFLTFLNKITTYILC